MSDRYSSANAAATQVTADREGAEALATAGALLALGTRRYPEAAKGLPGAPQGT